MKPCKYRVKNWRQFQHYKDRDPPWIKLHFNLLSSSDWVMLSDASRVLASACMLIASRHEGEIPDDPDYLQRVAYLSKRPDFKPLIECGFIELLASASECKQMQANDTTEAEAETETYLAEKSAMKPNGKHSLRKRLHPLPAEWLCDDPGVEYAKKCGMDDHDLDVETDKFFDFHKAKGNLRVDWDAAWRTWVRNWQTFKERGNGQTQRRNG